jgi:hypothetical protein
MAYTKKPLKCGETVPDGNTIEAESKGVSFVNLPAVVNVELAKLKKQAVDEQKSFTGQSCGKDCEKGKVDTPVPDATVTSATLAKNNTIDLKFRVQWNASVECRKKPPVLKPTNVKVKEPGVTGESTIAVIKYECIEGRIWVLIFNAEGTVEVARERTEQKCPITDQNPLQEYGWDAECDGEFWWVILKDPTTGKPVLKKKTDKKCKKEEDKDKGKDKGK